MLVGCASEFCTVMRAILNCELLKIKYIFKMTLSFSHCS